MQNNNACGVESAATCVAAGNAFYRQTRHSYTPPDVTSGRHCAITHAKRKTQFYEKLSHKRGLNIAGVAIGETIQPASDFYLSSIGRSDAAATREGTHALVVFSDAFRIIILQVSLVMFYGQMIVAFLPARTGPVDGPSRVKFTHDIGFCSKLHDNAM